jgi:metal-sulfur cluster biosynthetic enzyme
MSETKMSETTETVSTSEVTETAETKKKLPLTEDDVMEALQKVIDPELHMNIVELGLVYTIDVQQNANDTKDVNVEMTLTSPGCPYGPVIMGQIPSVVKNEFPGEVDEVNVSLTFAPPWDPATMASEDVKFELGIF